MRILFRRSFADLLRRIFFSFALSGARAPWAPDSSAAGARALDDDEDDDDDDDADDDDDDEAVRSS